MGRTLPLLLLPLALAGLASRAPAQAPAKPLPTTGTPDPRLSAFDDALRSFMQPRDIGAAVLVVRRGGKLIYERGFGWRDEQRERPLPVTTRFRLGPLSQVLTAAGVRALIDDGKLRLDTPVFDKLRLPAEDGDAEPDPRRARVTVQRLLEQNAGWDFTETFDPVAEPWRLAEQLKLDAHPTPRDYARFAAGLKLTRDPGLQRHETRLDALLLGALIESVAEQPYADFIRTRVLAPLDLRDVEPAAILPEGRKRDEVPYVHAATSRPVLAAGGDEVPGAYGGVHLEHRLAADGWLGSARSFAALMDASGATGKPPLPHESWVIQGGIPGSYAVAIWRKDGTRIVALFNRCADDSGEPYDVIAAELEKAAAKVVRQLRD